MTITATRRSPRPWLTALGAATTLTIMLAGCSSPEVDSAEAAADEAATGVRTTGNQYGTKAPYEPFEDMDDYAPVPDGYEPVLVEHLGRHGSRLLSSKKYDDLLYQLWQIADESDGLTELGEQLGEDLETIIAVHDEVGYGTLSGLGATEEQNIGQRAYERMQALFDNAAENQGSITFTSSGQDRATASGDNFFIGFESENGSIEQVVAPRVDDPDLLYFHKSDPEYLEYKENDEDLSDVLDEIESGPEVEEVAQDIVSQLFTEDFVTRIDDGEFDLVDNGKGKKHLKSVVDTASYLYELYVIAPLMSEEADVDFDAYISEEDAEVLAYISDANDFYEKGPGFEGRDVTYRMSTVLLDAFLDAIAGISTGETTQAADFRFAHAEEVIPFAALLQLPGSTKPAAKDDPYTYDNNPWRGAQVAPMAANIQWDAFENSDGNVIIRMLYNEAETAFGLDCTPIEDGSYFYEADELESCLAPLRG